MIQILADIGNRVNLLLINSNILTTNSKIPLYYTISINQFINILVINNKFKHYVL